MQDTTIKEHILKTTVFLLSNVYELDEVTVRKIAEEAHVATGLINYYFKSKDALLLQAVDRIIDSSSHSPVNALFDETKSPPQRLRTFLINIGELLVEYRKYSKLMLKHELLSDTFTTPEFIEPVLAAIKPNYTQTQIRYLAIQVVAPLQFIFLKDEGLLSYMQTSSFNHIEAIDTTLKNLDLL